MLEEVEEIKELIKKHNIKFIRYLYIDLDNVVRGRISVAENFESDAKTGLTLASVMQSGFTLFDQLVPDTVFGAVGEVRMIPDLKTFKPISWLNGVAQVICDQYTSESKIFDVDPRPKLKKFLANLDYEVLIGVEPEFYLFRKTETGELTPYDKHLCFATTGMNLTHSFMAELKECLKKMGIEMDHYYPEYGMNQHEVSLKPADPVKAADDLITFREAVKGLSSKYGLVASFMPKISDTLPGSGLHLHVSLWKNGENIFYSETDKYHLSDEAYYFMGGILHHLKALIAITAASVNSYKRLIPHNWASAYKCWGPENREAAVRIPLPFHGAEKQTTRFEMKFVDATAQPYLAIGSIIAAGMDGIEKKMDPGDPCETDPYFLSYKERTKKGWERYPETLLDAIRELDKSSFFRKMWGDLLIDEYVKLKKFQWNTYYLKVSDWEKKVFFEAF